MRNLADDPKLAEIRARLGRQLDAWMVQQGDKGMETELKAKSRQSRAAEESQDEAAAKVKRKAREKAP